MTAKKITAKEAMSLLLAGREVVDEVGTRFHLTPWGDLSPMAVTDNPVLDLNQCGSEFVMDYTDAIKAVLDGHAVEELDTGIRMHLVEGRIRMLHKVNRGRDPTKYGAVPDLSGLMEGGQWRVV